jgi:hypothetical protein
MDTHVRILAAFHVIFGLLGLVAALALLLIFGGGAAAATFATTENPDAWVALPIIGIVGSVLFLIALTLSIPGIIIGWGLLKRRPWARILGIVLSVLHLVNFPFGTVLAIYGLFVLLSKDTVPLFVSTPNPAAPIRP